MFEPLIKVENLSKKYCKDLKKSLWYGVKDVTGEITGRRNSKDVLRDREFWAVRDLNFEVNRGECLGLIGPNGAGKSTLLKMLNGLIKPDAGTIEMRGRVGALIELGAGFNPLLTGIENIYINATVLGLSKKEIDMKIDSIIDFAEIGDFINSPVQYYSSGMKVRLGFAVAAHMEPDILIIDEVLAVGDTGFRIKCYNVITELMKTASVIFVSHSMTQIARMCTNILLMDKGQKRIYTKNVGEGISAYFKKFQLANQNVINNGTLDISSISVNNEQAGLSNELNFNYSDKLSIRIDLESKQYLKDLWISLVFIDQEVREVAVCTSPFITINEGSNTISLSLHPLILSNGRYQITLGLMQDIDKDDRRIIHARYENYVSFSVSNAPKFTNAPIQLPAEWKIVCSTN
jgi:lipopolysaccharide transport system ATP-binding protein